MIHSLFLTTLNIARMRNTNVSLCVTNVQTPINSVEFNQNIMALIEILWQNF